MLDADGDEMITQQEFLTAAKDCMEAANRAKMKDDPKLNDMLAQLRSYITGSRSAAWALFSKFDANRDGQLMPVELMRFIRAAMPQRTVEEHRMLMAHMSKLDVDGNGMFDFDELSDMSQLVASARPAPAAQAAPQPAYQAPASAPQQAPQQAYHAPPPPPQQAPQTAYSSAAATAPQQAYATPQQPAYSAGATAQQPAYGSAPSAPPQPPYNAYQAAAQPADSPPASTVPQATAGYGAAAAQVPRVPERAVAQELPSEIALIVFNYRGSQFLLDPSTNNVYSHLTGSQSWPDMVGRKQEDGTVRFKDEAVSAKLFKELDEYLRTRRVHLADMFRR